MLKKSSVILALICALAACGFAQNSNSSTTTTRTRTTTPKTATKKPATAGTESGAQQTEETPAQKTGTVPGKRTPAKTEPTSKDVLTTFNALLEGIRHTDVNAITGAYWNSPQLTIYNSNGSVTKGWAQMHSNVESAYANLKDVTLETRDVRVQMLGRDGAVVSFLWTQSQTVNGTPETGTARTTLVYRRIGTSWKIVHRHTSPEAPDASRVLPSERTTPTPTPTPKVRP
jgi:ketosteroid isomerase-like protein